MMNTDWATHVAWMMTARMIAQMGWWNGVPLPGGRAEDGDSDYAEGLREYFHDYTEDGDYAEQEGFHEMNVFEELMRVATRGSRC